MDLTEPAASDQLFNKLKTKGIDIDVLINNAGYGLHGGFLDSDWEKEKKMLQLDIVALTHLTKLFGKDMAQRGGGYILLVSSVAGYQPAPSYASYAAAKAYVLNLGEALAFEFKKHNINLTVLSPSATATDFFNVAGQEVNRIQRFLMMPSRSVAKIGLKALAKGKFSIIPGAVNKLLFWGLQFVPRRWLPAIAYMATK
jgi:uncharacterized protein